MTTAYIHGAGFPGPQTIDSGLPTCVKCLSDFGAHLWHDDGTPGPGRDQWETGGPYAPPERVL